MRACFGSLSVLSLYFLALVGNCQAGDDTSTLSPLYTSSRLDVLTDYHIFWTATDSQLEIAINARTTGWVAFGIAEQYSGSMPGSDVVSASVDDVDGTVKVQDRFAVAFAEPEVDCSQDWEIVEGWQRDGWTTVRLVRARDTGDGQDRQLVNLFQGSTLRVIAAMGSSDTFGYHGNNRIAFRISLNPGVEEDRLASLRSDSSIIQAVMKPSTSNRVWVTDGLEGYRNINATVNQRAGEWNKQLWGRREFLVADGVTLEAATHGDEDTAQDVLLALHGFPGGGALYWAELCEFVVRQMAARDRTFACVALEMRGFNQSSAQTNEDFYNIDLLAEDVNNVAEQVCPRAGGRRVHLVAHDWGGPVAHAAALLQNDGRYSSLIGMEAPDGRYWAEAIQDDETQRAMTSAYMLDFFDPELPAEWEATNFQEPLSWFDDSDWFSEEIAQDYLEAFQQGCDTICSANAGLLWYTGNFRPVSNDTLVGMTTSFDSLDRSRLTLPVVGIWAQEGGIFNPERMIAGANQYAENYTPYIVPGVSHFDVAHNRDIAEGMVGYLEGLLESIEGGTGSKRRRSLLQSGESDSDGEGEPPACQQACQQPLYTCLAQCDQTPYQGVLADPIWGCYFFDCFDEVVGQMQCFVNIEDECDIQGEECLPCNAASAAFTRCGLEQVIAGNCTQDSKESFNSCAVEYCPDAARNVNRCRNVNNCGDDDDDNNEDVICDEWKPCPQGIVIPPQRTGYVTSCYDLDELLGHEEDSEDSPLWHLIAMEHFLDEATAMKIHHLSVQGYQEKGCDEDGGRSDLWAWTPGGNPLILPPEAGYPIFHKDNDETSKSTQRAYRSLGVQVHHDNPTLECCPFDDSGIRLFISKVRRQFDASTLVLGDPLIFLRNAPIPQGVSSVEFECPSESLSSLGTESLNVFGSFLHMHGTGITMYTELTRDGEVLPLFDQGKKIGYYDFNFQDTFSHTFQIRSGDSFRTRCYYETSGNVVFGLGSENEMCIDTVYYYPAIDIRGCGLRVGGGSMSQPPTQIDNPDVARIRGWPLSSSISNGTCSDMTTFAFAPPPLIPNDVPDVLNVPSGASTRDVAFSGLQMGVLLVCMLLFAFYEVVW